MTCRTKSESTLCPPAEEAYCQKDVGDQDQVTGGGYFAAVHCKRQNRRHQAPASEQHQVVEHRGEFGSCAASSATRKTRSLEIKRF